MNINRQISQEEIINAMKQIDVNGDQQCSKMELFRAFKLMNQWFILNLPINQINYYHNIFMLLNKNLLEKLVENQRIILPKALP